MANNSIFVCCCLAVALRLTSRRLKTIEITKMTTPAIAKIIVYSLMVLPATKHGDSIHAAFQLFSWLTACMSFNFDSRRA